MSDMPSDLEQGGRPLNFGEIASHIGELLPPRCEIRLTVLKTECGVETRLDLYDYVTDTEIEGLATRVGIDYDVADLLEARAIDYQESSDED